MVSSTGTWNGPFGYAGGFGYQEDATGLKLLGHRYYDSSTGRFLTRDPIKDGRNWYVYCGNNPVQHVDPNGEYAMALLYLLGAIVVAVVVGFFIADLVKAGSSLNKTKHILENASDERQKLSNDPKTATSEWQQYSWRNRGNAAEQASAAAYEVGVQWTFKMKDVAHGGLPIPNTNPSDGHAVVKDLLDTTLDYENVRDTIKESHQND